MVQINTDVPVQQAPKPIDYAGYGERVGNSIEQGSKAIGQILQAYKTVENDMDKEKMKRGMLSELQSSAPHVLKYMKPNASFEEVSKGAYQMAVARDLYSKLAEQNKSRPANQQITLPSLNTVDQLAFAADDKGFDQMVQGFNTMMAKGDTEARHLGDLEALKEGMAMPGTLEEKVTAVGTHPKYGSNLTEQDVKLLLASGTKEKDILAAKAKAEALDYKKKADKIKLKMDERKLGQDAMEDRVLTENVNKDYIKQAEDIMLARSNKEERAANIVTQYQSQRKTAVADMNLKLATYKGNKDDPALAASALSNYESAKKTVDDIDKKIIEVQQQYHDAIDEYDDALKYTTDQQTIFQSDMLKRGIDMLTPATTEANPEIRKGKLDFGQTPPAATPPAAAPLGSQDMVVGSGGTAFRKVQPKAPAPVTR